MFPGPWSHGGRHKRMFDRGALRYFVLDLVAEEPRHGYDVIKVIEERCGGFYSPSPGTVYPTLQLLEEQGLVAIKPEDGKKIYQITSEGSAFLEEHREQVDSYRERVGNMCAHPHGHGGGGHGHGPGRSAHHHGLRGSEQIHELKLAFREVAQALFAVRDDAAKTAALRELLTRTRREAKEIAEGSDKSREPADTE